MSVKYPISLLFLFICFRAQSQEIPLGTWRLHVSFDQIIDIDFSTEEVYAASDGGIAILDKGDYSLSTITKLDGLTGSGITGIGYDQNTKQLIVVYEDSNIDVVSENKVYNFPTLKNLNTISGSKRINDVTIDKSLAYLSSDFGVVVFDLKAREIKETWRDLGTGGSKAEIYQSDIQGDSIALATSQGVLIGNLKDNLLDFHFWKRYLLPGNVTKVNHAQWFNNAVYASSNGTGIFKKESNSFIQVANSLTGNFNSLESSANSLWIVHDKKVFSLNVNHSISESTDALIQSPAIAKQDNASSLWVGTDNIGLISNALGSYHVYRTNGPVKNNNIRLDFNENKIYAMAGGFAGETPLNNEGVYDVFENSQWYSVTTNIKDITNIKLLNNNLYVGSFSNGLLEQTTSTLYNESNSQLKVSESSDGILISALHKDQFGLWIVNYNTTTPIQLIRPDNTWEVFTPTLNQARYLTSIVTDDFGNVWGGINPFIGGGLLFFNPATSETKRFTETLDNGALPNKNVRSVALDKDNYVWVGTDAGVAYFFSETTDAVRPIFENRFLLKDEKINCIAIDGGNRKWMGTERGVWLFNPSGEELIYNFNTSNSPLLSNIINDIEINPQTGEVFIATSKGIASFRSDATTGLENAASVKIFPNPVRSVYSGLVGITGLTTNAIVKITDINGRLVWEGRANGGTASWNLQDYNGRKPKTGVYLVFSASPDGAESAIGKIVIIE